MNYGFIHTAMITGLDVQLIQVEADVSNGLPHFHMVGYLSSEVKEAAERVRTAIKNSNITLQAKKIVINLSPASIRKRGSSYDLPMAISVLQSAREIITESLHHALFIGELSLDGRIIAVSGILPVILKAKEEGLTCCYIPKDNRNEASVVEGIKIYAIATLEELVDHLNGDRKIDPLPLTTFASIINSQEFKNEDMDFASIQGQYAVKRATEIAVAGGHNMLLIGPPGCGKSMVASRISSISPPLSLEESLELTKIYSVLGKLLPSESLITKRPFRSIHHTTTKTSLIGGGHYSTPGEISLAHNGVLFLDELTEFPRHVLEVLRQPLEERKILISRNKSSHTYPANFMLICAMNPCPCGAYPNLNTCTCTPLQIKQYLSKISQPFLDRIDICIDIPKVSYDDLQQHLSPSAIQKTEAYRYTSKNMARRIQSARNIQQNRNTQSNTTSYTNATMCLEDIKSYCALEPKSEAMLKQAFTTLNLTARSFHKILKVARTIADLDQKEHLLYEHVMEAVSYRGIDKRYWGN